MKTLAQRNQLSQRLHLPTAQSHEDRPHAILSMSQAERFMTCPGSIMLSRSITTPQTSSDAAKEGTLAHTISELMFRTAATGLPSSLPEIPSHYDSHMLSHCRNYVNQILELQGDIHIEVELDQGFAAMHKNLGGTSDLVNIPNKHTLHVGDLKFGRSPVSAVENTQLLGYAVGARRTLQVKPKTIELKIYQPRGKDSVWSCSSEYLDDFEKRLVLAAYQTDDAFAPLVMSDKGCFWCRAKPICPEYAKKARAAAANEFAGPAPKAKTAAKVAPENLLTSLALAQTLLPWCDAVILQAKETLINDAAALPGYGLKAGRAMQKWKEPEGMTAVITESLQELSPDLSAKLSAKIFSAPKLNAPAEVASVLEDSELFASSEKDTTALSELTSYVLNGIEKSNASPSLIKVRPGAIES